MDVEKEWIFKNPSYMECANHAKTWNEFTTLGNLVMCLSSHGTV